MGLRQRVAVVSGAAIVVAVVSALLRGYNAQGNVRRAIMVTRLQSKEKPHHQHPARPAPPPHNESQHQDGAAVSLWQQQPPPPQRNQFIETKTAAIATMSNEVVVREESSSPPAHQQPTRQPTIAYMSQGKAGSFEKLWNRFKDMSHVQFYFHTFDRPCQPNATLANNSSRPTNNPICLFKRGTSFAQGRHILLRRALQDQEKLNITYYTFFDDDVVMLCGQVLRDVEQNTRKGKGKKTKNKLILLALPRSNYSDKSCWERYTDVLLSDPETIVPLQRPGYKFDIQEAFSISWQSCVDANFQTIHRDYLWLQKPASYKFQERSWFVKGAARHVITRKCFPYNWKVDNNFITVNPTHGQYPRGKGKVFLKEYLNFTFGPLGPWDDEALEKYHHGHRCEVSSSPPSITVDTMDPLCKETLQHRFHSWLNGTFEPELQLDETATETSLYTLKRTI